MIINIKYYMQIQSIYLKKNKRNFKLNTKMTIDFL